MDIKPTFTLLAFFFIFSAFSQDFSGKIIDKVTRKPVPYATIQLNEHSGTISNEEGFFLINLNNQPIDALTISCLGYTKKTITISDIQKSKGVIVLEEAALQLNEVFVSNKTPNADAIIAKVNANLGRNYKSDLIKNSIFYRETSYVDFDKLEVEVERASHVKKSQLASANSSLDSLSRVIVRSKPIQFTEFKGNLWKKDNENQKLTVAKATMLVDSEKDFSIENVQEKAQHIMLRYLDTTISYKIKTGIIKLTDSLSLGEEMNKDNEEEYTVEGLRSSANGILKTSAFYDESLLRTILNPKYYDYLFLDATFLNEELVYIIQFTPSRGKSKFSGRLYVSDDSYAVLKADYSYAKGKRGEKFNLKFLLGVKYIENARRGTIIYKKGTDNFYFPQYIMQEEGSYFYVSRPIKFIENTEERNKVAFDFTVEGNGRNKTELLFTEIAKINTGEYEALTEKEKVPYQELKKYEPSIWQNNEVLAPLEEMKNFNSGD
ncbi:carboxypeptidase-like regulatory domain-containing protein [Spongiimicrobium sp. 3-5]|uniref:carboxypeptidase-like regulatory domain-containing protein n=1 Tax=Spongiimicrobium sp. 3-5 TaxID=3332596 RepID=UPI00397FF70B